MTDFAKYCPKSKNEFYTEYRKVAISNTLRLEAYAAHLSTAVA